MSLKTVKMLQQGGSEPRGSLQVVVLSEDNRPVENARVQIAYTGEPDNVIEELVTNSSGRTESINLLAPPLEYSLNPGIEQPYSEYTLRITAEDFAPLEIVGTEILPGTRSIQNASLVSAAASQGSDIVILPNTLYGNYPAKIAEREIKPLGESGEIVLSRVVVPETVIVHDGSPNDTTAMNYYVPYREYIKNVASCEVYATWPEATLVANILAIMSFTLNRVYTEWYRNRGYDFTITSSTAYDHKWIYGQTIFENISLLVDEIFDQYLSRPDVKQPILTQYCDGRKVTCPNWMTQWGSKSLGDQGYSPIEILRHFYGESIYINTAEQIEGIPSSWPGYNLDIGVTGDKVRQLQAQLDRIAEVYSAIPRIAIDGVFGENTQAAVREFQSIFGLPQTGIVDFRTWYKISQLYVGVTGIAELT
ncbi:MAG: peptidoglycan-binding protein [Lachnospiraceae bacterium]|nr:peptidoglycan-binding protein [Lachnospiraceae bacterium]